MDPLILMIVTAALSAVVLVVLVWVGVRLGALRRRQDNVPGTVGEALERKHLEMVKDLNSGLNTLGDRLGERLNESAERLRGAVSQDLKQTRDAMLVLQLSQTEELSSNREAMTERLVNLSSGLQAKHDDLRAELLTRVMERLGEQGRASHETIQNALHGIGQQIGASIEGLSRTTDARLEQISGRVNERLEEGFKKTNDTFVSVMARLATIDEAQRKIDGLTSNVVSLQELLGDKRSRGAFGEIQLEALVRNLLPPSAYAFQHDLDNGTRVDCVLMLPEPTGMVAVDAKFPLENYHRMFDWDLAEGDRAAALRQFKADVRRHVDDICERYIVAGETADGAVMFVPAEAVFAEIHAHHPETVDYAMQRRVWIVSPTTMMAVLNTARAVLKDVETRRQVHIIKDELSKLGKEFGRFDQRMHKLAEHIRQAHQDAQDVRITSEKISRRFSQIERVELEQSASLAQLERTLLDQASPDQALPDQAPPDQAPLDQAEPDAPLPRSEAG
jgi:DNA recombination protein RmuC